MAALAPRPLDLLEGVRGEAASTIEPLLVARPLERLQGA